jgi:stage III sporulation protein AG
MTGNDLKRKITQKLKKGKYVLAVVVLGLILILWPQSQNSDDQQSDTSQSESFSLEQQEEKISQALSQIEGAGDVSVVLTLDMGMEDILAQDTKTSTEESDTAAKSEDTVSTVIVSPKSSQQEAVVVRRIYPKYRGALVVAQGADNLTVKLAITQAVAGLTGLGSDKITVIKMKD